MVGGEGREGLTHENNDWRLEGKGQAVCFV